jgi:hypothetical protein
MNPLRIDIGMAFTARFGGTNVAVLGSGLAS